MNWLIIAVAAFTTSYGCLIYMLRKLRAAGHKVPAVWVANIPLLWSPWLLDFNLYRTYMNLAPQKGWSRWPLFVAIIGVVLAVYSFLHYCIIEVG